jgi:hypothetical protein
MFDTKQKDREWYIQEWGKEIKKRSAGVVDVVVLFDSFCDDHDDYCMTALLLLRSKKTGYLSWICPSLLFSCHVFFSFWWFYDKFWKNIWDSDNKLKEAWNCDPWMRFILKEGKEIMSWILCFAWFIILFHVSAMLLGFLPIVILFDFERCCLPSFSDTLVFDSSILYSNSTMRSLVWTDLSHYSFNLCRHIDATSHCIVLKIQDQNLRLGFPHTRNKIHINANSKFA